MAADSQAARRRFEVWYRNYWQWVQDLIRDYTPHARALEFDFGALLAGPAVVGSAAEVVDRIGHFRAVLDLDRMIFMFDLGGIPDTALFDVIERFGSDVLPRLDPASRPAPRVAPVPS